MGDGPQEATRVRRFVYLLAAIVFLGACSPGKSPAQFKAKDSPPQRIVSLLILGDELLWQFGPRVQKRVVGISHLADDPRFSGVVGRWPNDVSRLRVQTESILALQPDLVLAASFSSPEVLALLRQAGIPLLVFEGFNSFAELRQNIDMLGEALHEQGEAKRWMDRLDQELEKLKAEPLAGNGRILSWADGMVAGRGTTLDDASKLVGLENIASSGGIKGYKRVTLEQVVLWDPDWLVIGCVAEACQDGIAALQSTPGLSSLRAVQHHRYLKVPGQILSSTGWDLLRLAQALSEQVRPDLKAAP